MNTNLPKAKEPNYRKLRNPTKRLTFFISSMLRVYTSIKAWGIPVLSIGLFIVLWHIGAKALYQKEAQYMIQKVNQEQGTEAAQRMQECINEKHPRCQPNTLPTPFQVWQAFGMLMADHHSVQKDKKSFKVRTLVINEERKAKGKKPIKYTGRLSFVDQIATSLLTVFAGFLLAMFIAIPLGILVGISSILRKAFNWLIHILKPVSPVVWFLLVFMVVKTLVKNTEQSSAFIISFVSVGLCSLWATLINTAMGVSSVDQDYLNVASVLRLSRQQKIVKIILPASLPLIFTGLRITLSVAWMVLIAIELLAQNPGLGSFVWEEFQNGASDSNAKIIVAMFIIGSIGFFLDQIMLGIQRMLSYDHV